MLQIEINDTSFGALQKLFCKSFACRKQSRHFYWELGASLVWASAVPPAGCKMKTKEYNFSDVIRKKERKTFTSHDFLCEMSGMFVFGLQLNFGKGTSREKQ